MNKFIFNSSCFFGAGVINELANEIKNRHFSKPFVITDDALIECGVFQKVAGVLIRHKIESVLFSDVPQEPSIKDIKNALASFKKSGSDFILAIGGGSVIDIAKAVSVLATNPMYSDVVSLKGHKDNLEPPLPVFAIPTTAGSASEVSKSFVAGDDVTNSKLVCFNDKMLPLETFIDPELMTTMPDIVTLSSGFDALTHAIECIISKNSNYLSEIFAKEAISIIFKNLALAYDNPDDLDARENMALGSYLAGLAYSNSGLGLCHSIAHALGGKFKIPHGIALAMTLPAVLKFNMYSKSASKYELIAKAFGLSTSGLTEEEICRLVIREFEKFRNRFNIPKKLSEYGVTERHLDLLAYNSFEDACTKSNPREITMTDIYLMIKKLL